MEKQNKDQGQRLVCNYSIKNKAFRAYLIDLQEQVKAFNATVNQTAIIDELIDLAVMMLCNGSIDEALLTPVRKGILDKAIELGLATKQQSISFVPTAPAAPVAPVAPAAPAKSYHPTDFPGMRDNPLLISSKHDFEMAMTDIMANGYDEIFVKTFGLKNTFMANNMKEHPGFAFYDESQNIYKIVRA